MSSGHVHSHGPRSDASIARLKIALGFTFVYMIAEAVGGFLTNSLALLADAGHMLTDVAAMALTLFAFWFAARPATPKKTYGYYRMEILAAFVNGVALVLLSLWVVYEAIDRWQSPPDIKGTQLLLIAFGGLVVNLIAAWLLHSGHKHDLNMRGAFLHVIGDLLGSVAAIVAGILIVTSGWMWADAAGSILISLIIIVGAWRLILDSVNVLLEGTPRHIDLSSVEDAITGNSGVIGIHDLHIWTISSGIHALSVHISHDESVVHSDLLSVVRQRLHEGFGIDHLTIQMETAARETEAVYICETGTKCFEPSVKSKFANG
ncbi:MAG TPA: cation diffusion facilitator family transporter [Pyrinomonadaceae bacterium]|nr:cation diffusion facilitator family transporter [Pyrinomonadaceae bacterium]